MRRRFISAWLLVTIVNVWATPVAWAESPNHGEAKANRTTQDRVVALPSDSRHTLWVPKDYQLRDKSELGNKQVDLLVDFHGSPAFVRNSSRLAGLNCVVISVKYGGLSSVYRRPFSADRKLFDTILSEALVELRAHHDFPDDVEWGRLAVSSFSAGFGAVRELLKTPAYFDRIDGILMVDSLYCGYVGDGTETVQQGVVHPGLMKDFLRFAQQSAQGEKVMIITHCDGPTPGYASTRETADYLLEKLKLTPQPIDTVVKLPAAAQAGPGKLQLYRQAVRKGFSLYGSPGPNETDHGEHLRHIAHWLPGLPLAKRRVTEVAR